MPERAGSIARSPFLAFLVFLGIPLLYSGGQEIVAKLELHDSYYFLLRSESYDLWGYYFAPIREYTYSLFVFLSRALGFHLRTSHVLCYGASLFALWFQTVKLTRSPFIGWVAVLPSTVLTYQHPVFNTVMADVLQLILVPLSFASAIMIYRSGGALVSSLIAGLVAGLHVATRAEGFLFLAPPLVALVFVCTSSVNKLGRRTEFLRILRGTVIVCLIPVAFLQALSAVNKVNFGFWAPTIMTTDEFKGAYSALMSIEPAEGSPRRFAPVSVSALERAYEASPAFRKAKFFFDENSHGKGWSGYAFRRYRPEDGSIDGGQFRWALLHAISVLAGNESKAMLAYLDEVTRELRAAFDSGRLKERSFISETLGPQFSIVEPWFWRSLEEIGRSLVHLEEPYLPEIAVADTPPEVESNFNRLALRRPRLVESPDWRVTVRFLGQPMGPLHDISLNRRANKAKIELKMIEADGLPRVGEQPIVIGAGRQWIGFELRSPGSKSGELILAFDRGKVRIPLVELASMGAGTEIELEGVRLHPESVSTPTSRAGGAHFAIVRWVANTAHNLMSVLIAVAVIWLVATLVFGTRLYGDRSQFVAMVLIAMITLSIILPRWVVLSALDSAMAIGLADRYLAAAGFSIWYLAAFCVACGIKRAVGFQSERGTTHA